MPGKQRSENPKHDASYKNFFTHHRTVADTLRAAAGDIAQHLEFATLEQMPASFVTEHLGQRHTDMLWRIGTVGGDWVYIFILLEFQSTVDRRMALRMMDYTATIWLRLGKKDLGPGGEYPYVLPVVIYNGERRWTAATDIGDLVGAVPGEPLGYRPRLRYLLVEVRTQDSASLPQENVLAMIARFEQAPTAGVLEELVGSLGTRLEVVGEPELNPVFWTWIELVLTLRHGSTGERLRRTLRKRREERGTMTLIERARKWGEERDRLWLQKGIEQERQASIQRERELVHRMVGRRFGPRTAQQLLPILGTLSDQEDIALIADALIECETAAEFLARVQGV
ncbi:MAG: Rpn family recombination-promoting nuclease/putative transposase [Gemmatimonadota bacterium]|nr:Rpn family recombination-promoting nuclease/putative transposase [Gemmatimonadota bacterium]